ncbi:MAG: DUF2520 domain-containing protein [Clostridium sp.]|nr:DUF2520 domain-containing protein [Clostridium sp.]
MKIGFVGAGKVGFSLGKYFVNKDLTVIGYYSRNLESSKDAAEFTSSRYFSSIKDLLKECDTIFITTVDDAVKDVWNDIQMWSIKNKIICHCSGSLSSKVFSNIDSYDSYGYSIHPMFAFSDKYNSYKKLNEAFFTIEGSKEKLNKIVDLLNILGNEFKIISSEDKVKYHAASVFVSNHVLALMKEGVKLLIDCGFQEEEAIKALYPLMLNNVKNIKLGFINSLTGPLERGDELTVKKHLECLECDEKELYKILSRKLLEIAKTKNMNRDYKKIEDMIGE